MEIDDDYVKELLIEVTTTDYLVQNIVSLSTELRYLLRQDSEQGVEIMKALKHSVEVYSSKQKPRKKKK